MSEHFAIKDMTVSEKVDLMEQLWENLSGSGEFEPPSWHGKELKSRRAAVKEGAVNYRDWEVVKKELNELKKENKNT